MSCGLLKTATPRLPAKILGHYWQLPTLTAPNTDSFRHMKYRYLDVRRDGAVEYLTLNRPDVRNAFNDDVAAELTAWASAAREAAEAGALRVVVVAGAGATFC